jgi:hypothetical protein
LGLSIAEGKAVLAAIQAQLVVDQVVIATYWGLLKQPDKQKAANGPRVRTVREPVRRFKKW